MRVLALLVLAAAALPACSGLPLMGVRQDKEDQAHAAGVLERAATGRQVAARQLIEPAWSRLWVLPGGTSTQAVEDRIGLPFPAAGVPLPAGTYLVFDDGERVVSAFTLLGATGRCLRTTRAPLGPQTPLVAVRPAGGGPAEPSTAAGAARCR